MIREASEHKRQLHELVTQIEVYFIIARTYKTSTIDSIDSGIAKKTEDWQHRSKKVSYVPTISATESMALMFRLICISNSNTMEATKLIEKN